MNPGDKKAEEKFKEASEAYAVLASRPRGLRVLAGGTDVMVQVNARNLWGIVRAAKGSQLLVNASASVFNEIVLRAALRIRAHYTDLSAHLTYGLGASTASRLLAMR